VIQVVAPQIPVVDLGKMETSNMLRLRPINEKSVPHNGWRYTQPKSELAFHRPSLKWLVKDIRIHREAMLQSGEPPQDYDLAGGWQERLLHDICLQMDGDCPCEEYDPETGKSARKWLGLTDMVRFLDTVRKWLAQGPRWESKEEAKRRAEICLQCPHHQYVSCFGCRGLLQEVSAILGKPQGEVDTRLQGCAKCGCQLAVKVYMPKDAMADPSIEWPQKCWMKESSSVS
jgi:hypothetical protein